MAWYDSIVDTASNAGNYIGGLFDNNKAFSVTQDGASGGFTKNMSSTPSGGLFDGISNFAGNIYDGTSNMFDDKTLGTIGKVASAGKDIGGLYNSLVTMPEYYKEQNALQQGILDLNRQNIANTEAERQRQIAKEAEAQASMANGFNASGLGLYDDKKKQQVLTDTGRTIENSNYYAV